MRTWRRLGSLLIAGLSLVAFILAEARAQERRLPPSRGEIGTDARMLVDLEILRDLELLRQLDLLRNLDEARSEQALRGAKTDEKGKP